MAFTSKCSFFALVCAATYLCVRTQPMHGAIASIPHQIGDDDGQLSKRALNPFTDSVGKRSAMYDPRLNIYTALNGYLQRNAAVAKRQYFDALSGTALGKRQYFDALSGKALGKRVYRNPPYANNVYWSPNI